MEKKIVDINDRSIETVLHTVGDVADALGLDCYVVGGFVRDLMLGKKNDDIDFVVVGSGLRLAKELAKRCGMEACLYESYGTAKVTVRGYDLEFVGARKEFYHRESRNPIVEDGTLEDDLMRRDFTINNMAICVNENRFGEFIDISDGMKDIGNGVIRCVGEAAERFSEDPLRMLRCIRFASRFGFNIEANTFEAIRANCERIHIITRERIVDELNKMIMTDNPRMAFVMLLRSGLLKIILPEVADLYIEGESGHKDMFEHTMSVLSNVVKIIDDDLWLRWAALLHDIGKVPTRHYDKSLQKWTFTNHESVGSEMVGQIFKRLGLPLDNRMEFVKKMVKYHMRPKTLCEENVTDSGIRRLLFDLGNDIDELMALCKADITTQYSEKREGFWKEYDKLVNRIKEVEEKDNIRNFQPALDGNEIMEIFKLKPSREVGEMKEALKNAVLDAVIDNEHDECVEFLKKWRIENGKG